MASARQLLRVLCARSLSSLVGRTACQTRAAGLQWRPVSTASCSRWRQREPMLASRAPRVPSAAAGLGHRWSSGVTLTLPELEEQVLSVLKMFDKVKPDQVTLEAHFVNDLGMDSLDAVEVVMAFEDEFGCEITDEEAEKIFCAKDAVELLKTKLDVH